MAHFENTGFHIGSSYSKYRLFTGFSIKNIGYRGHPRAFREGEVLRQFQDFREKVLSKFLFSLYILCIFTSPSAQDREKSASLGRLFLPNRPLG